MPPASYRSANSTVDNSMDTSHLKNPKRVNVIRKYPTVIPIILGSILLVCFFSSVLINIFGLVPFPNPWSRAVLPFFVCGHGFWGGALYALAGSLTIAAGKLKIKALIYGSMVTCLIAAVSVAGVIACSCVGLSSRDITLKEVLTLNLTMLIFGLLALGCCIWAAYIAARLMCECCQPDVRYTSAPTSPNQSQSQEGFLSLSNAMQTNGRPTSNNSFNQPPHAGGKGQPVSMNTMPGGPRMYDQLNSSATAPLSRSSSKPSSIMSDPASEHQLTSLSVVQPHKASQKLSQMSLSSSTAPPYREECITPPVIEQGNYPTQPQHGGYPAQPLEHQTSLQDDSLESYNSYQNQPHQYVDMPSRGVVQSNRKQVKPRGYNQPPGGYGQQPAGGYNQHPAGGYNQQPAGGYNQQPAGGYNKQPAGGYGQQHPGGHQQYAGGPQQHGGHQPYPGGHQQSGQNYPRTGGTQTAI